MAEEGSNAPDGQPRDGDRHWTFTELPVSVEDEYADPGRDLVLERFAAQDGIGQTFNAQRAAAQGLSYTPPADPPTILSEGDPQGVEIAAGFAHSISRPQSNAPNWSVISVLRLQDHRIRAPARAITGSLRSTEYGRYRTRCEDSARPRGEQRS